MRISDLPCDMESEILSKIPTKSLAKLQTICKRWTTLLRDPNFVKKKLDKSEWEMIFLKNGMIHSFNVNLLDPSLEFRGKLCILKSPKDVKVSPIFHCEGLLLFTMRDTSLMVCNPCTGEIRSITEPKNWDMHIMTTKSVLGYEKNCHNYKILRFSEYYIGDNSIEIFEEFKIYDFSSDSWRVLDGVIYNWWFNNSSTGVSLKGNTYWRSSEIDDEFILSFDFTTERFSRLSLPFKCVYYELDSAVLSVVRDKQLSVLHKNSLEIQIWVTNNIGEAANEVLWSKFLVVDFGTNIIKDVLISVGGFVLDEDHKVAICFSRDKDRTERTRIHIIGEHIVEQVYERCSKAKELDGLLLSYVPSLVHIQNNTPKGKKVKRTEPLLLGNVPSLVRTDKNAPEGKKVKHREVSLISSSFSFWSRSFWARLVMILLFLLFAFAFEIGSVE